MNLSPTLKHHDRVLWYNLRSLRYTFPLFAVGRDQEYHRRLIFLSQTVKSPLVTFADMASATFSTCKPRGLDERHWGLPFLGSERSWLDN